jgi:hypothetical protein
MKKILLSVLSSALVASLILVSCKKEDTSISKEQETITSVISKIGVEHNNAIDEVYNMLIKQKNISPINISTRENVLKLAESCTNEFYRSNMTDFISKNSALAISSSHKVFCSINSTTTIKPVSSLGSTSKGTPIWPQEIEDSLSVKQKELLTEVRNAIDDSSLDLQATLAIFEKVRVRAEDECTQNESYIVLAAIEIANHSLTYWHDNYTKWVALAGQPSKSKGCMSFSWKQVGKADVACGVGGAVGSGVACFFGPIGWAAFGAATLGSAVGGSVTDIILQLW